MYFPFHSQFSQDVGSNYSGLYSEQEQREVGRERKTWRGQAKHANGQPRDRNADRLLG